MVAKRIYLAGPEVFLINAIEVGENKKRICLKHCFEGVFSLDAKIDFEGKTPEETGLSISKVNEELIKSCDILIANITPFRGPSVDVGTAYEMGVAHALGKKVLAYTNVKSRFTERTIKALNGKVKRSVDGKIRDSQGMFIEENQLTDNLMIDGCIHINSGVLVVEEAPADQVFTYLAGFEKCVREAKKIPSY
ncbi:MAG: nucleoside 2-deoxyribosyltransferase [Candidatus Bathyarchaeota archaeon]|nr:nucleoside 2-deoxyribosyltransferase [Candidatus Bathyarchaeota archaeon]